MKWKSEDNKIWHRLPSNYKRESVPFPSKHLQVTTHNPVIKQGTTNSARVRNCVPLKTRQYEGQSFRYSGQKCFNITVIRSILTLYRRQKKHKDTNSEGAQYQTWGLIHPSKVLHHWAAPPGSKIPSFKQDLKETIGKKILNIKHFIRLSLQRAFKNFFLRQGLAV